MRKSNFKDLHAVLKVGQFHQHNNRKFKYNMEKVVCIIWNSNYETGPLN